MPTKIAWTDETWNPVHGCSKVSAGCENCYAERISYHQYGHTDLPWTNENAAENVSEKPEKLGYPSTLDEPKRIFVNSMSDLFHSEVSTSFIRQAFGVMRNHPEHIFQILTKRPGRAAHMDLQWPPNVWMGTSVEDHRVVDRLDLLRGCDADVLFVSFEPLIAPVVDAAGELNFAGFDWAIVGGESGPGDVRREMAHEWVWPIRRACEEQDVAFFFKQSSAHQPEQGQALRCPDGVRREFKEMPEPNQAVQRARKAVADGGRVVAEFRHRQPDDPTTIGPGLGIELDANETTATCSVCGYFGIVDDNPEITNAGHLETDEDLVCDVCEEELRSDTERSTEVADGDS